MKIKLLKIGILSLICILNSCTIGVFHNDLGNSYAWIDGDIIVKIKEEMEKSLDIDVIIRPQVLNYAHDDRYIIVYQVYDGGGFYDSCQREEEKDSLYIQFAKLKAIKHCYWIIDKETDNVMGPMKKSDFDRKCEELHVEAKLRKFHEKKFWKGCSLAERGLDSLSWEYDKARLDSLKKTESQQ